ncbi:thioredoxin [Gracilibacillus halophilus YIM-C55.5]|uniref:Thioredoxin n=1 Tax=Gracilibacillus halophilus YIM-C55.5 TaxID=1308866 RepID=N4WX87_9BACI|nr:TlpA disulfide reductase family protein [Gracilibacillus halophilus]ENH97691.1 thioredoxin [Gracilibacillus halophilus YIM-C55.5]
MKRMIIGVLVLSMLAWATFDFFHNKEKVTSDHQTEEVSSTSEAMEREVGLKVGQVAPDFTLQTIDGETVKLSDYRGDRVMLNFWATWCPPCREEMPDLQAFYQDSDAVVLGINMTTTEQNIGDVRDFIDEYQLSFPILVDSEDKVAVTYQIHPLPTSYMIDSKGVIQFRIFGPLDYEGMMLEYNQLE